MRPVEFASETIIEAGQKLKATGRNITGFALRQRVGGGNPTRLKQVWDEHLASQSVTKTEPVAELPIEVAEEVATVTKALTERLATLAVELNDKAVKAAERKVHEVVLTAGEQREQAERELADAAQTVDDLESKLDAEQATGRAQAVELAQFRERITVTEQTAKAAEVQHAQVLSAMTERLVKAEAGQVQANKDAGAAREDAAKLRGQVEALQSQAADLVRALSDWKGNSEPNSAKKR